MAFYGMDLEFAELNENRQLNSAPYEREANTKKKLNEKRTESNPPY